jgi:hypothetical protein
MPEYNLTQVREAILTAKVEIGDHRWYTYLGDQSHKYNPDAATAIGALQGILAEIVREDRDDGA